MYYSILLVFVFFVINIFLFISFNTQHHNITSTQNKQNKTADTYSTPQKSSQKEESAALQTDNRPEDGAIQSHILSMSLVSGHRK